MGSEAAGDGEQGIALQLGRAMHRSRRGDRFLLPASIIVTVLMLAGTEFDSSPYYWVMAAQIGLPWIALGVALGFWGDRYLAPLLFSFTSFLPMIAYEYVALLRWMPAARVAGIGGAIFTVAAATAEPQMSTKRNRIVLILVFGFSALYSFVAVLQLNCLFDHSPATVYKALVSAKRSASRGADQLRIEPWGTERASMSVGVPYKLFRSVQKGDTVCVVQRDGWLGMPWVTVQACPWNGGPVVLGRVGTFRTQR